MFNQKTMTEEEKLEQERKEAEAKAEFEASLEGLSEEEKAAKIAEKEAEDKAKKDIDFEKELEALEPEKKQRTPQEIAAYNAKKALEKAKEAGVDVSTLVGEAPEPETSAETVVRRVLAEQEARKLSRSEAELKVIMFYVNKGIPVADAHLLANKSRLQTFMKEKETPPQGGDGGQRTPSKPTPMISPEDESTLIKNGFKKQADGSYQGQRVKVVTEGGKLVRYKKVPGTKDSWEKIPEPSPNW